MTKQNTEWEQNCIEIISDKLEPLLQIAEKHKDINFWNEDATNLIKSMQDFISQLLKEQREEIINEIIEYQNGYLNVYEGNDGFPEYEFALEYKVIDDLLTKIKE